MNETVLKRICYEILGLKNKDWEEFIAIDKTRIQEQMKDPDNVLEFLKLFGEAIGITSNCSQSICCEDCKKYTCHHSDCIRAAIRGIMANYKKEPTKYQIVITTNPHRTILPGRFTKEQAEQILKAYDSDEYTMEEVK